MPELHLTPQTNLQQLRQFLDDSGDHQKVHARQEGDTVVLYTSSHRKAGLLDKLMGTPTGRETRAKEAIGEIFSRAGGDEQLQRAMQGMFEQGVEGSHIVRVSQLKDLVQGALNPTWTEPLRDQLLECSRSNLPGQEDRAVDFLTAMVKSLPDDQRNEMLLSTSKDWKQEMVFKLNQAYGGEAGPFSYENMKPGSEGDLLLTRVFNRAMANVQGDEGKKLDNGHIMLEGHEWEPTQGGGEGGFGTVAVFRRVDDHTQTVALKTPKEGGEEILENTAREIRLHQQAMGEGHEGVVGFRGVIRTQEGQLLVAMERANDNTHDLVKEKLQEAIRDQHLHGPALQLVQTTMLKEMLEGVEHMHGQGMIHGDVKPANFITGLDGRIKLMDFGESHSTPQSHTTKALDNPMWLAPEVVRERNMLERGLGEGWNWHTEALDKAKEMLVKSKGLKPEDLLPGGMPRSPELQQLVQSTVQDMRKLEKEQRAFPITQGVDTWSMGCTAYQIFHGGESPMDMKFVYQMEQKLLQHGQEGPLFPGDNLTREQGLINRMLDPDPNERPSITEVLQDPMFTQAWDGVPQGMREPVKDQVHQLVQALQSGDMDRVRLLGDQINGAFH